MTQEEAMNMTNRQAALDVLCQEHRYRIPGKRETYSQYNEAWQDALDRAEGAIGNLPSAHPNLKGAKFEIICSQRQTGRTTKLIEKCARYRYALIVCPSRMRASYIFHYARKMGKHIPMPMTFGDFLQGRFAAEHINAFLIDDLDSCLEIYSHNVPIDTVVFEGRAEE